jgi:hypothetical protein
MSTKSKSNKQAKAVRTAKPEPEPTCAGMGDAPTVSIVLARRKVYPDGGVSYSVPGMKGIVAFKPNVLIPGAETPETLTVTFPAGFNFIAMPKVEEKKPAETKANEQAA